MRYHLDLFSGIGGFAIAAQNCGYTTIGFCEKEKYAQQILKERFGAVLADAESHGEHGEHGEHGNNSGKAEKNRNRKHKSNSRSPRLHDDIFTLNGADYAGVDLLTGGFPCQPFSVAGKRRGAEDDRALWPEMLRVIDGSKPRWLIGENVAGIVTMELDNILSDLEGIGYAAWPLVIPACAVDARHRRDRVWIVAHSERSASGQGCTERRGAIGARAHDEPTGPSEDVAHAERRGQSGQGQLVRPVHQAENRNRETDRTYGGSETGQFAGWLAEPELGRVAHGIPNRAHRLRGLGNAIVPQVAEEILRAIASTES